MAITWGGNYSSASDPTTMHDASMLPKTGIIISDSTHHNSCFCAAWMSLDTGTKVQYHKYYIIESVQ